MIIKDPIIQKKVDNLNKELKDIEKEYDAGTSTEKEILVRLLDFIECEDFTGIIVQKKS